MPRAQHLCLSWLAAGAWLGLVLAACQEPDAFYRGADGQTGMGQGGNGPTGAAGAIASGAAGTSAGGAAGAIVSGAAGTSQGGAAGSIVSGAAGASAGGGAGGMTTGTAGTSAGGTGGGGTTGAAGTTGIAGTTGTAGRGGTTGAAGSAGRGGTSGNAGSAGRGGTIGTGGRGGRGGGTAGTMGTAGTSGAGGNSCPLGGRLDCTAAGSLELAADGQVVDFTAAQWNTTAAKWCNASGLDGGLSSYAGTSSTAAAAVDPTARNLRLNFMVVPGGYAGGRINFDSCVDASSFRAIQFTASLTAGSLTGCVWQVQLQTQNQRPTTLTNPMGGTCNSATTTCEQYPAASLAAATATATPFTAQFSSFGNASAIASQIVGVQWQVNSGNSGSGACTVELRIDDVRFVTQ